MHKTPQTLEGEGGHHLDELVSGRFHQPGVEGSAHRQGGALESACSSRQDLHTADALNLSALDSVKLDHMKERQCQRNLSVWSSSFASSSSLYYFHCLDLISAS